MSDLPSIDPAKVAQKLLTKVTDLTHQTVQLEVLAESLRDERDAARRQVADLTAEVSRLSAVDENPEEG